MGEYRGQVSVNRPAMQVFGFLADIGNMPHYLPTVRQVTPKGGNRLLLEVEADGHRRQAEGWLEVDQQQRRMRWGSDQLPGYRGELQVNGEGEGCEVALHLQLDPLPDVAQRMAQKPGGVEAGLRQALERTLDSIRQALESNRLHEPAKPTSRLYGHTATMNTDLT